MMTGRVGPDPTQSTESGHLSSFDAPALFPERFARLTSALRPAGATALLIGPRGSGKERLAEAVAFSLHSQFEHGVQVWRFPASKPGVADVSDTNVANEYAGSSGGSIFERVFPSSFAGEQLGASGSRARRITSRILSELDSASGLAEPILILPRIGLLIPLDALILEVLVRSRRVRIIATAHRVTGAVEMLARDLAVAREQVEPLSLKEADRFLRGLLQVEAIEDSTLGRWHALTGGNLFALRSFAESLQRQGVLRSSHHMLWSIPHREATPEDLAQFLVAQHSAGWRENMLILALGGPLFEPELMMLLNAHELSEMMVDGLIVSRTLPTGESGIDFAFELYRHAILEHTPPTERIRMLRHLYDVMHQAMLENTAPLAPHRLTRAVGYALAGGLRPSLAWLWNVHEVQSRGTTRSFRIDVALAIAGHPDATMLQRGVALLQAIRETKLAGDAERGNLARQLLDEWCEAEVALGTAAGVPPALSVQLRVELVFQRCMNGASADECARLFDLIQNGLAVGDAHGNEVLRSARALMLALQGKLREALTLTPMESASPDMTLEWIRLPARAVQFLILEQRGRLHHVADRAEQARWMSKLGEHPNEYEFHLLGLCWFLEQWIAGSRLAAREVLHELSAQSEVDLPGSQTPLVELCVVLLAIEEGRWRIAEQRAHILLDRIAGHDGYGIAPLVHAAFALALAVAGERDEAEHELMAAAHSGPGVSLAVSGVRKLLILRAEQWLGRADVSDSAARVAAWAREEKLEFIELAALHSCAVWQPETTVQSLERARELVRGMDSELGQVMLGHMVKIARSDQPFGVPEVRVLADYGIWLPLPHEESLSSREREIALFASLAYSSRWIAEQLHLSTRTVETHLSNVFVKTGTRSRSELREWFAERPRARTGESSSVA